MPARRMTSARKVILAAELTESADRLTADTPDTTYDGQYLHCGKRTAAESARAHRAAQLAHEWAADLHRELGNAEALAHHEVGSARHRRSLDAHNAFDVADGVRRMQRAQMPRTEEEEAFAREWLARATRR